MGADLVTILRIFSKINLSPPILGALPGDGQGSERMSGTENDMAVAVCEQFPRLIMS
jgi:hypothetical protein